MDNFHQDSVEESLAPNYRIWQDLAISGILRDTRNFGEGWWYRLQPAEEVVDSQFFEQTKAFDMPLRYYARSCFPLPDGACHVVWAPQWVPAKSVSRKLKISFWERMSFRFWDLTKSLEESMIWREEVEQYINSSRYTSEHLCTRTGCAVCEVVPGTLSVLLSELQHHISEYGLYH